MTSKLAGFVSLYLSTLAGERYTASLGLFQRSRLGTGAPSGPDSKCCQQISNERPEDGVKKQTNWVAFLDATLARVTFAKPLNVAALRSHFIKWVL